MGNRNIIGSSDYGVENNLYKKFLNPPNPLFQRGNVSIILLLLAFFTTCTSISLAIEPIPSFLTTFYGSMKLKEELNLTGTSLKELIGDSQKLSGLTQVNLKNYETSEAMDDSTMESVSNGYRERLTDEGWQMIMQGMNEGKIIMIYGLEKENIREKLMVIIFSPSEVSEMTLIGKIELSSLEDLRDMLLKAMPKFSELKPMEALLQAESPSQQSVDAVSRWKELIGNYGFQVPSPIYYELASAYEIKGEYEKAIELYESLIKREDTSKVMLMEVYYWAGWDSERLSRVDDARKYYILLIEHFGGLDTNEDDYIASAEMALKRLDKIQNEPESVKALMEKAETLYHKQKNYIPAIDVYKTIIENMPDSSYVPSATLMLGLAYGHVKQAEKQLEAFENTVKKYQDSTSHLYLAMAYQNQDKYKEALEQYKIVINDYPNASPWQSLTAYYNAAECAKKLDKLDEAKGYYRKVVDMYSTINSPMVGDVEREILKIERGGKLPFLGLGFRYRESREGAYIVTVFKNGPCKDAGVQRSDLLLAIDSEKTPDPNVAVKIIANKNIGDKVVLSIKRGEDTLEIPVTLTATPDKLER